jgi:UDP:flavonoid glycosyltransferase YjiC (YdhE family)
LAILFLCIPAKGRFEVLAPLAKALVNADHEVWFACPENFNAIINGAGFKTVTAGLSINKLKRIILDDREIPPANAGNLSVAMFTEIQAKECVEDLLPVLKTLKVNLIIHEEGEFSGPLIASIINVPCITVGWPVAVKPIKVITNVTDKLTPLWEYYSQPKKLFAGLYEYFIVTCPPSIQAHDISFLSPDCVMRPELFNYPENTSQQAVLESLRCEKIVHLTLGTVDFYNNAPHLISLILDSLKHEKIKILLTTGDTLSPDQFSQYQNVLAVPFIPHHVLLPYCDAVICHGGAGTTIASLIHGLPLLIIPRGGASQYRNAFHCSVAGAGCNLIGSEISHEKIAHCTRRLLYDPTFGVAAAKIRREIEAMPGKAEVVAFIESLI